MTIRICWAEQPTPWWPWCASFCHCTRPQGHAGMHTWERA